MDLWNQITIVGQVGLSLAEVQDMVLRTWPKLGQVYYTAQEMTLRMAQGFCWPLLSTNLVLNIGPPVHPLVDQTVPYFPYVWCYYQATFQGTSAMSPPEAEHTWPTWAQVQIFGLRILLSSASSRWFGMAPGGCRCQWTGMKWSIWAGKWEDPSVTKCGCLCGDLGWLLNAGELEEYIFHGSKETAESVEYLRFCHGRFERPDLVGV